MKPSQRIYQQRDIAQSRMAMHARYFARYTRSGEQKYVDRHLAEFTRWETITETLTAIGAVASGEEQKERKAREKKYVEACERDLARTREELKDIQPEVVEEPRKLLSRDNLVNPFSDYVQIQLDNYFATTTNTVTLNTSLPPTGGKTYTFSIPRFKVAPVEEEVEGII